MLPALNFSLKSTTFSKTLLNLSLKMEVFVGEMIDPSLFWVVPVVNSDNTEAEAVYRLEQRLSALYKDHPGGERPNPPKSLFRGLRVAVKSSRRASLWQRAEVLSVTEYPANFETCDPNPQIKADLFLIDVGKTLNGVDVDTRVRVLPPEYQEQDDLAFQFRLDGLVPIHRTMNLDMMGEQDHFKYAVASKWNEECIRMTYALIKTASSCYIKVHRHVDDNLRLGSLRFEFPLQFDVNETILYPFTRYIGFGMFLKDGKRFLDLNECLVENMFAVQLSQDDYFSNNR